MGVSFSPCDLFTCCRHGSTQTSSSTPCKAFLVYFVRFIFNCLARFTCFTFNCVQELNVNVNVCAGFVFYSIFKRCN